jgi:hypothetical protein
LWDPGRGKTIADTVADPPPGIWEVSVYANELARGDAYGTPEAPSTNDGEGPVEGRHAYDLTVTLTSSTQ